MAILNTVMKTAKTTAFIGFQMLRSLEPFFSDWFLASNSLSIQRHGIRMYVLETVKFSDEAKNSMIETLVFAMKPFEIVVCMKFFLYL